MSLNDFSLVFSGFDMTTIPDVYFSRRFPHELPVREVKTGRLARAHGQKLLSAFYGSKKIIIEGYIRAVSRAEMEIARDTLIFRLQPQETNLDIQQGGLSRTYTVTMQNILFEPIEGGMMLFNIEFLASDPFGRDLNQTVLTFDNPQTEETHDYPIIIGGSMSAELILSVTLASGSGMTDKTMSVVNVATGEKISIRRNYVAGEVVFFNIPNRQVTIDGDLVDYLGVFPLFEPGPQVLRYIDNFTTRSVSLAATYYRRYL